MEPPEYTDGYEAYEDGVPRIDNPHPPGSDMANSWDRGWDRAKEEDD